MAKHGCTWLNVADPAAATPRFAVDTQQPRQGGAQRPLVDVAVGILIRADGAHLLTSRPPGKAYAGFWEFPGGKLEAGEGVQAALARELLEEIGVEVHPPIEPWRVMEVDYPHALVRLHLCKLRVWSGSLHMREGQDFSWQDLPPTVAPILPGTLPILEWLLAERRAR